ncbi:uncharacterized protein CC84DRAFT_1222831 [Paraphaeosphaeria sporulosa]|uniref:Uncharacterized protein n=1 Tax=Paraphaeosphaeria sporulosa TaxID=1460663 RepID=A0A177BYQ9_9PLEO|nr:uncharacterized protein CC84DRAFT_1222831 [Paraphaeosphaeria sporulosa]OAF99828.1 hypothetical protein CC84DRAFT_1222831 [Paraphaeosphaeria sporulosa]
MNLITCFAAVFAEFAAYADPPVAPGSDLSGGPTFGKAPRDYVTNKTRSAAADLATHSHTTDVKDSLVEGAHQDIYTAGVVARTTDDGDAVLALEKPKRPWDSLR